MSENSHYLYNNYSQNSSGPHYENPPINQFANMDINNRNAYNSPANPIGVTGMPQQQFAHSNNSFNETKAATYNPQMASNSYTPINDKTNYQNYTSNFNNSYQQSQPYINSAPVQPMQNTVFNNNLSSSNISTPLQNQPYNQPHQIPPMGSGQSYQYPSTMPSTISNQNYPQNSYMSTLPGQTFQTPHMPPQMPNQDYQQSPMVPPSGHSVPGYSPMTNQPGMRAPSFGNMPQQQTLTPDKLPSAIEVIKNDQNNNSGHYQSGTKDRVPPLVTTDFLTIDGGVCSPKFIRSSIYSIPTTPDMLKNLHIPFVLNITPFSKLEDQEKQITISDMGEKGPLRCLRCKAYMSPLMVFIDGGRRFQCKLCGQNTEVPMDYFVHLDQSGRRMDCYERPELCLGSYELMATKEYCKNDTMPLPPAFLFLIDVSYFSAKSGLLSVLCRNIAQNILPYLATDPLNPNSPKPQVGFITYDRLIHFYNLKNELTRPQMYTVSMLNDDQEDSLVPLVDGFLVDIQESADQIAILLENILENFSLPSDPTNSQQQAQQSLILGPAIKAGMEALKSAGNRAGKLFVFHSCLPTAEAPGKLNPRDDRSVLGTEKEKNLFASGSEYYTNLAKTCVDAGVSIDLFLTPSGYMDIATLAELPRFTGGNIYKYDFFSPSNDEFQLVSDLQFAVSKPCAFDAVMKVRTSLGTKAVNYFGNFSMDYTEDVKLACLDSDQSVVVEIMHNDKLQENNDVYVQVAVLYTSISGQRRLRIHNTSYPVISNLSDIFKMSELDTIMNWMCKQAIMTFRTKKPSDVRTEISNRSANILATYRRNYGESNKAAELILPENLKLLPLYSNCLIKCDFLQSGTDLVTDERAYQMFLMNGMNVKQTQAYLYPRLLNLKEVNETGSDISPSLRDSYSKLVDDCAYLIENGMIIYIWIGANIDSDWMLNVFNCQNPSDIGDKNSLPVLENPVSKAIHKTIDLVRNCRSRYLKLKIVVQGDKLEGNFKKLLVEDKHERGASSYTEFVYHIHKEIRNILSR